MGRTLLLAFQQQRRVADGSPQRGVGASQLVGQGRVFGEGGLVEAIQRSVMGGDDLRGEQLLHRVARSEGRPGGGRGGEALFVFRAGFVGLGAQGAGEGAQQVSGEGVVRVDSRGCFGLRLGHGAMSGSVKRAV